MALVVKDRIKETSTTSGTGTLTLAGAASGFRSFADIGNGNTTYYAIVDNTAGTWEVGIGTYTSSGTTLSRSTILSNSSGTTSAINFAANSKDVFVTYPSDKSVYEDESENILFDSGFGSKAVAYGCRAWVNFNGTGTIAIRSSGNISSISDTAAGRYTLNFTNAMTDANYCIAGTAGNDGTTTSNRSIVRDGTWTTTACQIRNLASNVTQDDVVVVVLVIR